jgi:hypothetical protein
MLRLWSRIANKTVNAPRHKGEQDESEGVTEA